MRFNHANILRVYLLVVLMLGLGLSLHAKANPEEAEIRRKFEFAMSLLESFKTDSAILLFSEVIHELKEENQLSSSFGLRVQLRYAEALEKDEQNETAIKELLEIEELSINKKQWDVLTHSYLSLARLYEKLERKESCKYVLSQAMETVNQYQLDSIYPRLAIRLSSYHRFYGNPDTAIFYAQEAIHTAPRFKLGEEEATGNILMGMLLDDSHFEEIVQHFTLAGSYWKEVGDFVGYGAIMKNLSRLFLQRKQFKKALHYGDSALNAFTEARHGGYDPSAYFYLSYKERAEIFRRLGTLDSSLHYLKLGYELQLEDAISSNTEKVIEVEKRFNDEKRLQKIQDQEQIILLERENRNWLLALISIVVLFSLVLILNLLRLRRANQTTRQQAMTIRGANRELSASLEQQIMLQGEVHHRVKNNLQILIGLFELQSEEIKDPQALKNLEAMAGRIYSMAAIHEILYLKQGTEAVRLLEYTQKLCQHFGAFVDHQSKPVFSIDMANDSFNLATLMPLGIILNELLTNSLKYAARLGKQLKINISLHPHEDGYSLLYRDNGPGFPDGELYDREGGLGSYLLKSMCRQLTGYMESKNDNGAVYHIFFKEKNPSKTQFTVS